MSKCTNKMLGPQAGMGIKNSNKPTECLELCGIYEVGHEGPLQISQSAFRGLTNPHHDLIKMGVILTS